jgi:hypothetical protein
MPQIGFTNPFTNLVGMGRQYLDDTPNAAYGLWSSGFKGGGTPFSRWLGWQQPKYQQAWEGSLAKNPQKSFIDYLLEQNPVSEFYGATSPQERGENPRSFLGRTRWTVL